MLAMISQPMNGKTDDQIRQQKQSAEAKLKELGYEVLNTFFEDDWANEDHLQLIYSNIPVAFLARSIDGMAKCNAVYFCKGWEDARGCKIENSIAEAYGLTIFYEE